MVFKCCVPGCRGNYDDANKVSVFSFPKDNELRVKWERAIHRDNFVPTKNSKVCEVHFKSCEIERTVTAYDAKNAKFITAPLDFPRLVKGAIPSLFPGLPKYLSEPSCSFARGSPESKRSKRENEMLMKATLDSVDSESKRLEKVSCANLCDVKSKLHDIVILTGWIYLPKENEIYLLHISEHPHPKVEHYIKINSSLMMYLFHNDVEVKILSGMTLPVKITDILQVEKLLYLAAESLNDNMANMNTDNKFSLVKSILDSLLKDIPEKKASFLFLKEQLSLLQSHKNNSTYSVETLLFCGLVHSISASSYRFIRNSQYLQLPHPSTIKRFCGNLSTNPQYEQDPQCFLSYIKSKFKLLNGNDKTVIVMLDEVHLKPSMDYKGGTIVGHAFDNHNCATSAHVFMINSLLSPYKDVVHVMPVTTVKATDLFKMLNSLILELENIGFEVLAVVSDNNSINRKTMSFFSNPPQLTYQYLHPSDPSRPLFFLVDSVHILKNIRNNWINQKGGLHMHYPDFIHNTNTCIASFDCLKEMHAVEKNDLLKYGYGLTLKALNPNALERQNVKLVLQVFNKHLVSALRELGPKKNFECWNDTANYIEIFCRWWDILNVKTLLKGQRLLNPFEEPITKSSDHIFQFLNEFLKWLNVWEVSSEKGKLTRETHQALKLTTEGILKISLYCLNTKGYSFLLPGKIQTDKLEERFGKYRQRAGSQYHIGIRQLYEIENKLRIQSVIPLMMNSGTVTLDRKSLLQIFDVEVEHNTTEIPQELREIYVDDFDAIPDNSNPVITYIAGYCSHLVCKRLKCEYCKAFVTVDYHPNGSLISANDRGGLCYPQDDVVQCAVNSCIIINKLLSSSYESQFLGLQNHRSIAFTIICNTLYENILFEGHNCSNVHHTKEKIIKIVVTSCVNMLLNNYTKKVNDNASVFSKRKLKKLNKSN